jgi:hypothetical protein
MLKPVKIAFKFITHAPETKRRVIAVILYYPGGLFLKVNNVSGSFPTVRLHKGSSTCR